MPITTERLLTVELTQLVAVDPDRVDEAFAEWTRVAVEAAGTRGDQTSSFDWGLAREIIRGNNEQDGDPDRNDRVVRTASQTTIQLVDEETDEDGWEFFLHEPAA